MVTPPDGCTFVGKRTVCPFKRETTIPIVDHPASYGYKTRVVYMKPRKFMEMAQETTWRGNILRNMPVETYTDAVIAKPLAAKYGRQMRKGDKFPMPYIEFRDGTPKDHEGRHRAIGAEEAGVKRIPIIYLEKAG